MTYSAMERFNDALRGVPRDRVPICPMIAGWAAANFSDSPISRLAQEPKLVVDAQVRAFEATGFDALYAYADPLYIPEAFGCKVRFPETGPFVEPLDLPLNSLAGLDKLRIPVAKETGRLPGMLEMTESLSAYGGGKVPILGLFEGPFTTVCRIFEPDSIMRMIYKNPDLLEALLDRVNGFLMEFGSALIEGGINVLFIPDPTASASMISPSMFRKFVMPGLQKLTEQLSAPFILHIRGDTSIVLEGMGQSGADILSLDQCMNLAEARKAVPGTVLGGNVDPINSLLMGTREQVETDTLNCLRSAGVSHFVLMTGCGVPPKTPAENLEAMVQTAREYGLGPGA